MGDRRVLVVGASGSGKTCLIKRLGQKDCSDFATIPTIGQQNSIINNISFTEVGGQLQPLWVEYAQDANVIM